MKALNIQKHEFHFILDQQSKRQLIKQKIFKGTHGLSNIIVSILRIMYPRMEKEHLFGRQRNSHYQKITSDPEQKRCSVHVYLPVDLYRRLKLIHHDLNFYSIAQCLRFIIHLFLELLADNRIDLKQHLIKLGKGWQKQNAKSTLSVNKIRQLLNSAKIPIQNLQLINLYNQHYSPLIIFRC